ncbi:MAG: hypothetical protein WDN49_27990 [Acetobacteraceae bacterium]
MIAVAGLPPFGLFTSEFLVVMQAVPLAPLAAVPLLLGLVGGAWVLIARLQVLSLGPGEPDRHPAFPVAGLAGAWLHLALVLVLGPGHAGGDRGLDAGNRGGRPMSAAAIIRVAPTVPCRPWPRHLLPAADWRGMADAWPPNRSTCWRSGRTRPRCMPCSSTRRARRSRPPPR